jgi:galactarate dehydratase
LEPLYIRVHPSDNVAIIVNPEGVPSGAVFPNGFVSLEAVPQSHKIALSSLEPGEPVIRYGQVIGHATRALPAGSWVREDCLDLPTPPALSELALATAPPPDAPPLPEYTFEGYRNADGTYGGLCRPQDQGRDSAPLSERR